MSDPPADGTKRRRGVQWLGGFCLGVAIVLPAVWVFPGRSAPRELRRRAACCFNLRAIALGMHVYLSEHDRFPPELPMLVRAGFLRPEALVCPGSQTAPAPAATTQPADLAAHCDYVYAPGVGADAPAETICVFELPANHRQRRANTVTVAGGVRPFALTARPEREDFVRRLQRLNDHLAARREAGP